MGGQIHNSYNAVLNCMRDANNQGNGNPDWPTFVYLLTPQVHKSGGGLSGCGGGNANSFQNEDIKFYGLVSSMVGSSVDWSSSSPYHVGFGDCVHYMHMG